MASDAARETLEFQDVHGSLLVFGPGSVRALADALPPGSRRVFLVSDDTVMGLHGPRVRAALRGLEVVPLAFRAGEASKTRATLARIQDRMSARGVDRGCVVVALGGGVVSDLAGLAAATLLRGLVLVNVPTTLVGAVDAAIGGKNGVDTPRGKNLLGTFHWPRAVIVDFDLLATLPPDQWRAGLAEVLKHGVVSEPGLLDDVEAAARALARGRLPGPDLVRRAAMVKARVVAKDPYERGLRRILNFGHTVGHAIESATGYAVGHGAAVATGMVVESRIACRVTGLGASEASRILQIVRALGLPAEPPCGFEQALLYVRNDKKSLHGAIRMSLPRAIGEMDDAGGDHAVPVPPSVIEACWNER